MSCPRPRPLYIRRIDASSGELGYIGFRYRTSMVEQTQTDHETDIEHRNPPEFTKAAVTHRIGEEYVETDEFPREDAVVTRLAYEMLGTHHERLYDDIPVPVHWTEDNPYEDAAEMFERIDADEELWVFAGGSHPEFLNWTQNVKGRAVHDYFGHYQHRVDFSVEGEYRKWQAAREWYPVATHRILFTEIVAQRCAAAYLDGGFDNNRFCQRAVPAPRRWIKWCRAVFDEQ